MGVEDGADGVEFLDGEGVERVVGGVGAGFGLDAVFGGAPGKVCCAVEEVGDVRAVRKGGRTN
ncbi:primary amine oxidase-like [Pyrus ussuriensis x Pyrus communis]|uniref:Primary amine oxidase-like n=1 Tax=Pyrus ussuriensis x Pyrus communis TaxID=2448454 RepID=A0A5N5EW40_9ROSA|nr:primary amine oxidase-like [Pyrus ussuriensis x Pyrus communis]